MEEFVARYGGSLEPTGIFIAAHAPMAPQTEVLLEVGPAGAAALFHARTVMAGVERDPPGFWLKFVDIESEESLLFLDEALRLKAEARAAGTQPPDEEDRREPAAPDTMGAGAVDPAALVSDAAPAAPAEAARPPPPAAVPASAAPAASPPPPIPPSASSEASLDAHGERAGGPSRPCPTAPGVSTVPPPPPPPPQSAPAPQPLPEIPRREPAGRRASLRPASTLVMGIDLGTTYSCVAIARDGKPEVVSLAGGHRTIPSVVFAPDDAEEVIGWSAYDRLASNPRETIYGHKRLLGRSFGDPAVEDARQRFEYQIAEGEQGEAAVKMHGRIYSLSWVSARLLEEIRTSVAAHSGENVINAVITVPAYYGDRQRHAILEAARDAGIEVLQLVNEPTAAAIAYGVGREGKRTVLVYDLGGGTFDVSVLEIEGNVVAVLATGGDSYLGGVDFDSRIVAWATEEAARKGIDVSKDPALGLRLRQAAEGAKRDLSAQNEARIVVPYQPVGIDLVLTRDKLNRLVADLVDRTLEIVTRTLEQAQIAMSAIDDVVFVGGQTRTPLVAGKVHAFTGKAPRKGVHPDEAVACGAAILGFSRDRIDAVTLVDVVSQPIGVGLPGGRFREIVPRNTRLPATKELSHATVRDGQTEMKIDVYQGESARVDGNDFLGTLVLRDLPPRPRGEVTVRVEFKLDAQGFLQVAVGDGTRTRIATLVTRDVPETLKEARAARAAPVEPRASEPGELPGRPGLLSRLFRR